MSAEASRKSVAGRPPRISKSDRGETVIALIGGVDQKKSFLTRVEPLSHNQVEKMRELFGDMFLKEEIIEEYVLAASAHDSRSASKGSAIAEKPPTSGVPSSSKYNTTYSKSPLKRKNAVHRKVVATINLEKDTKPSLDGNEALNILRTMFGFTIELEEETV